MYYFHTCHPDDTQIIAFITLGFINISIYIFVFAAAIIKALDGKLGEIIQAVYCTIFTSFLVFNELKTFGLSDIYFGFLNVHHGKGLLMLFLGCIVMCENAFNIIVSIFSFTMGLGYVILSFVPNVPLPKDVCSRLQQYWNRRLVDKPNPHHTLLDHHHPISSPPSDQLYHHHLYFHPASPFSKQPIHPMVEHQTSLHY
ncbi:COPI associated protein-domain-containing protein [Halteromyces radiatus]|uniref:COPI associated protein-domain-containing protein n=1 Tax=Halteromyces radiatus TaxID=101107 RepID=UPI00222059F0|nr:COPI associated protein-domain-containing protein [Halteromyces radiatus]KAI8081333.1 COPI associated protein-domain-containing protein [Halteromyces radiatus]